MATSKEQSDIKPAATLIFTWGNPSRGDDAIGPEIYQRLQNIALNNVELQTDFQLQIEHAVDLENRKHVLFIDASVAAAPPYEFHRIQPDQDDSYTTHAMSPQSLLTVYEKVNKQPAPNSFLLSVRGYEFGLGLPLSAQAELNIEKAINFIQQEFNEKSINQQQEVITNT